MKTKHKIIKRAMLLLLLSTLNPQLSTLHAQGTAFTYQTRLNAKDAPAAGTYAWGRAVTPSAQSTGRTASPSIRPRGICSFD
jgi:hypothetical protein